MTAIVFDLAAPITGLVFETPREFGDYASS
jgi:hypothetical protein